MKKRKLFALMVGINQYEGPVSDLSGSVNDMENLKHYLEDSYRGSNDLCIETLKNSDAARGNIIHLFRKHLGKARQDDVALFYYSGHGSRQPSAPGFKEFFPEGVDETLVCRDSRTPGGQDLADKELAVLLAEVAVHQPHIAVVLDCCHSGSATREGDNHAKSKNAVGRETGRSLESYLDGCFTRHPLNIPTSPHVLLAACKREQLAWEINGQGAFTYTLLDVLGKRNNLISYADLFVRCRFAIRKRVHYQDPQFESYGGFNAYSAFLDGVPIGKAPRCTVFFEGNAWKMDMGALHGIPTDPLKCANLDIYRENTTGKTREMEIVGQARIAAVNAQVSILEPDFPADTLTQYKAEIQYFPLPPLAVYLEGEEDGIKHLEKALEYFPNIAFTDTREQAHYRLSALHNKYLLFHIDTCQLVEGIEGYSPETARYILADAEHIRRWEYNLEIQNHATKFDQYKHVDFIFVEINEGGKEREYSQEEIMLDFKKVNGRWQNIPIKIKARNNTPYTLYFALFYFSRKFGIHVLANEPVSPGNDFVTLCGNMGNRSIFLPDGVDEALDIFKLIVSTEKVDSFLLEQEDLKLGEILSKPVFSGSRDVDTTVTDDWFTKTIRVKTVRQRA